MSELRTRHCTPCTGATPKLSPAEIAKLLGQVPGWTVADERLARTFEFRDFVQAMRFVDALARIAEAEQHHPDFCVHYRRVEVSLWTHAIGGLSENDFIVAAKLATAREEATTE